MKKIVKMVPFKITSWCSRQGKRFKRGEFLAGKMKFTGKRHRSWIYFSDDDGSVVLDAKHLSAFKKWVKELP